jgi:hypothetical protein
VLISFKFLALSGVSIPIFVQNKTYSDVSFFLEIPVFHFLNARITFGNINASLSPVSGVQSQTTTEPSSEEETGTQSTVTCSIDADRFSPPSDYVDRSRAEQHSGGFIVAACTTLAYS